MKPQILCVEDNLELSVLIQRRLSREGFDVDITGSAEEAVKKIDQQQYDLILTDYQLPAMSGLQLLEQLKRRTPTPPVVMVTGHGDERAAVDALRAGVDDYVIKDGELTFLSQLPHVIQKTIDKEQLKREKILHEQMLSLSLWLEQRLSLASSRLLQSNADSLHSDLESICDQCSVDNILNRLQIGINTRDFHFSCGTPSNGPSSSLFSQSTTLLKDGDQHYGSIHCEWQNHGDQQLTVTSFLNSLANLISASIKRIELEQQLKRLAHEDVLTGVNNRRKFTELAAHEILRGQRYQHPACVIMLDIDNFKTVNDSYGHAAGDRVLVQIAKQISQTVRPSDIFGRFGGEEFVLLLPETVLQDAMDTAERIRQLVEENEISLSAGTTLKLTISLGVSVVDQGSADPLTDALELADQGLYDAKHQGRNQVCSVMI